METEDTQAAGELNQPNGNGIFDTCIQKLVSRKLLVFATATALLALSDLSSETWGLIAMCYISGQAAIDALRAYKWG